MHLGVGSFVVCCCTPSVPCRSRHVSSFLMLFLDVLPYLELIEGTHLSSAQSDERMNLSILVSLKMANPIKVQLQDICLVILLDQEDLKLEVLEIIF